MTAGARTFSIEDALLDPPALPPPPLRHALFVSLIALAALLHLATLGWADLYNHTEGHHARTGIQRLYRRRNFLRRIRLSTATRTESLVPGFLDLLRAGLPDEKFAWLNLPPHNFYFPRAVLPRSAFAFPSTPPLGVYLDLRGAIRAVVHRDRTAFPRLFAAIVADRMVGTPTFFFQRSRER